jgi:hypothetical protein
MDPITLNLRVGREPPASAPGPGALSAAEIDANFTALRTAADQLDAEKFGRYISATAPNPAVRPVWITPAGELFVHDGDAWFEIVGKAGPAGPAGADGAAGANGTNGTNGTSGADSTVPGPAGADGIQGITGSGGPDSVSLSANQAFSTTALADVTSMPTLTLAANTTYIIELIGSFESAATTTGIGFALNVGGTVTRISGYVEHATSATARGACSQEANNAVTGATTGVRAIAVPVNMEGRWFVQMGATGGTAQLRCRSEIASSAVTLHAGTRLRAFVA